MVDFGFCLFHFLNLEKSKKEIKEKKDGKKGKKANNSGALMVKDGSVVVLGTTIVLVISLMS